MTGIIAKIAAVSLVTAFAAAVEPGEESKYPVLTEGQRQMKDDIARRLNDNPASSPDVNECAAHYLARQPFAGIDYALEVFHACNHRQAPRMYIPG